MNPLSPIPNAASREPMLQRGRPPCRLRVLAVAGLAAVPLLLSQAATTRAQSVEDFPEIRTEEELRGTLSGAPQGLRLGPFRAYRFEGRPGVRYVADARSDDFDTYLILAHPVGGITEILQEDDDGGEGTDSRLSFSVEAAGTYLLIVRAWSTEDDGSFRLSLAEPLPPPLAEPRPLEVGSVVEGRLVEGGSTFVDDWDREIPYDLWVFRSVGGTHLQITLESEDFDAYLEYGILEADGFVLLESDDDGGGDRNARLDVVLPTEGEYAIRARPYGAEVGQGRYVLRLERLSSPGP